jgi:hypothetical protein
LVQNIREITGNTTPYAVEKYLPAPNVAGVGKGLTDTVLAPAQLVAHAVGSNAVDPAVNAVDNYYKGNFNESKTGEAIGQALPFLATAGGSSAAQAPAQVLTTAQKVKAALFGIAKASATGAVAAPVMTPETNVQGEGDYWNRKRAESKTGAKVGGALGTVGQGLSAWASRSTTPAAEVAAEITPEITPEVVGKTARKASGKGLGASQAKTELAQMAEFNPEAKAQADRLGMELPADVLSDNPQVRSAAGLTRSVAGSQPEAGWRTTVSNAADQADKIMAENDAHFAAGTTSPGSVSAKVNKALISERDAIAKQANDAYGAVNDSVPKETPVQMDRLGATLADVEREVGPGGMSKQESRLISMLGDKDNPPTYGRLIREKNLIGQAIGGQKSPYGDMETGALKRLYGALSEDQLANVGDIAGSEMRSQLHGANLLFAKQKGLESRITGAFGNTMDGSIAGQMRNAITQSAKGDTKAFNSLIKTVPGDLHKETLITALADATRSNRGVDQGGFGFSEFAKTWRGIQANPVVYDKMNRTLGPETVAMLNDLQGISQRLTESRANVLTTGKANQALVNTMAKQTTFENLMDSTVSKTASTAAGAAGGGPVGAAATSLLHQALSKGGRQPLRDIGNLFNSPEFLKLVEDVSSGAKPSGATVEAVVLSPRFQNFVSHVKDMPKGVSNRATWLMSRIAADRATPKMPTAASTGTNDQIAENK